MSSTTQNDKREPPEMDNISYESQDHKKSHGSAFMTQINDDTIKENPYNNAATGQPSVFD